MENISANTKEIFIKCLSLLAVVLSLILIFNFVNGFYQRRLLYNEYESYMFLLEKMEIDKQNIKDVYENLQHIYEHLKENIKYLNDPDIKLRKPFLSCN